MDREEKANDIAVGEEMEKAKRKKSKRYNRWRNGKSKRYSRWKKQVAEVKTLGRWKL
jgi:hypothetical protein